MTIEKFIKKNKNLIRGTIETFVDKETAKELAEIAGVDLNQYGLEMLKLEHH